MSAIEAGYRYPSLLPKQNLGPLDAKIRALLLQRLSQSPVPTTNIEKTATRWDQFGEKLRKTSNTPVIYVDFVDSVKQIHYRWTLKRLEKKLDRIIAVPAVRDRIPLARSRATGFLGPKPADSTCTSRTR